MSRVYENELGYYIRVYDKLKNIIENLIKTKIIDEQERVIKIKLCGDGTNCGNFKKLFNFNFSVLNESICKSAKGHYTIGVFEIANENYKELTICLSDITRELREIKEIEIGGKVYEIRMYMGGDLKFLASVYGINAANSMYPCLWCKCCKTQFNDFEQDWSFVDPKKGARRLAEAQELFQASNGNKEKKFGYINPAIIDFIDFDMCVVDMLHLFMRICDKLIELLLSRIRLIDMPELSSSNEPTKRSASGQPVKRDPVKTEVNQNVKKLKADHELPMVSEPSKRAKKEKGIKKKGQEPKEESACPETLKAELAGTDDNKDNKAEVVTDSKDIDELVIDDDQLDELATESKAPVPTLNVNHDLKKLKHFSRIVEFIQNKMKIRKPYYFKDGKPYIVDLSGERKLKLFAEIDLVSLYPEYENIESINRVSELNSAQVRSVFGGKLGGLLIGHFF